LTEASAASDRYHRGVRPKPGHLAPEFAAQYQDEGTARAYPSRPPYPAGVFDVLVDLLDPTTPDVLDAGAGTGDVARPLAERVRRVDALDPSAAMTAVGRSLPGGDRANLRWVHGDGETGPLSPPYGLVTAGQSLAWMEWSVVLPRWKSAMTSAARVALVERRNDDAGWWSSIRPIVPRYSTNRGFRGYDLVQEVVDRGLFVVEGRRTVEGVPARRTVERILEGLHSMNGLTRARMGAAADAFDEEVRDVLAPFARDGTVEERVGAEVTWGRPT
jgi:SAM-dependent methyltransferase